MSEYVPVSKGEFFDILFRMEGLLGSPRCMMDTRRIDVDGVEKFRVVAFDKLSDRFFMMTETRQECEELYPYIDIYYKDTRTNDEGYVSFVFGEKEVYGKKFICRDMECVNCFVDPNTLHSDEKPWLDLERFRNEFHVELKRIYKTYDKGITSEQIHFDIVGYREDIIDFVEDIMGICWRNDYSEEDIDGFLEAYDEEKDEK